MTSCVDGSYCLVRIFYLYLEFDVRGCAFEFVELWQVSEGTNTTSAFLSET